MKVVVVFSAAFLLLACGGGGDGNSATSAPQEPQVDIPTNAEKPPISQSMIIDLSDPNRSLKEIDLTNKKLELEIHPLDIRTETRTYTLFENVQSTALPDVEFPSWTTGKVRIEGKKLKVDIKAKESPSPQIPAHQADSMHFIIGDSLNLRLLALNEMLKNKKSIGFDQSTRNFSSYKLTSGFIRYSVWPGVHMLAATHKFKDTFYTSAALVKSFGKDALELNIGGTIDKYTKCFYQSFLLKKNGYTFTFSSLIGKVSTTTFSVQIQL